MSSPSFLSRLARLWRHRWIDAADVRRALPPAALERLTQAVAASERRHSGEIRICVEAGLPYSYLRRTAPARERAIMMFGKLRVWDTERNNGVLIYLLLAEHAIEIVADRGIERCVPAGGWATLSGQMATAFGAGRFEDGLMQGVQFVGDLMERAYPLQDGEAPRNELPDAPVVLL